MIIPKQGLAWQEVGRHYDELDAFYREIWGEHVHHGLWLTGHESPEAAARQLVELVAAEAGIEAGTRVCDIGAGYGATARMLAREYGARVTALTLSGAQYAYACACTPEASPDAPRYVLGDWLENDLPDASFDVVLAIESASHMIDKQRFLAEAARVLRPGGRFVFCAWLADEHPRPWHTDHLLEPICREGCLPGLATAAEYCGWLEDARLTLLAFEDLSRRVQRTWPTCIRRTLGHLVTRPRYARYLLDARNDNRSFAVTMLRLWLGYRTGTLRYGLFKAYKPRFDTGVQLQSARRNEA